MKPIKMTPLLKRTIREAIIASLDEKLEEAKLTDSFSFNKSLGTIINAKKPTIIFEKKAWRKIQAILECTDKEVAWYGLVDRKNETTFIIKDILIYPQLITAVTVTTDDEAYTKWFIDLDDSTRSRIHFQAHSHVNMGVSPSGTDKELYRELSENLRDDDFYIFAIFNKKQEVNIWLYDLKTNLSYGKQDLEIKLPVDPLKQDILAELEENLKQYKPTPSLKNYPKTTHKASTLQQRIKEEEEMEYNYMRQMYGQDYADKIFNK